MSQQYGWPDCPEPIRQQVQRLIDAFQASLSENLIGMYLHGSLAMNCFNPVHGDIDVLAVVATPLAVSLKYDLARSLLRLSGMPSPIEISVLGEEHLRTWEYPTPYDFHYSEIHRSRIEGDLTSWRWRNWNSQTQWDLDLAAHITVLNERGVRLIGQEIAAVFPTVPREDYIDSIIADYYQMREADNRENIDFVLNTCRIYAFLLEGKVCSKVEGGLWAVRTLPPPYRGIVRQALDIYRGNQALTPFDANALVHFSGYMNQHIRFLST